MEHIDSRTKICLKCELIIKNAYPSKYFKDGCSANTLLLYSSMLVTSLLNKSRFFKYSNSSKGFKVSKSFILFPDKLRCVSFLQPFRKFSPLDILLSESSSFLSLGSFGKPLSVVSPTLLRLRFSRLMYSSVNPTMVVLLQLSRFSSFTCNEIKMF